MATKHAMLKTVTAGVFGLLLLGTLALAHGNGRGRTQIQFSIRLSDPTTSRFIAKIDISGALTSNGNTATVTSTSTSTGTGTGTGDGDDDDSKDGEGGHGDNGGQGDGGNSGNGGHGGHEDALRKHGGGNGHGNHGGNGGHGGHSGNGGHGGHGGDGGMTSNGNTFPGKSGNFKLAGDTVTLSIGSASFTGTADRKGRVSTPFEAKLTADGNILQIEARGLNLQDLLPIDPTDGAHQVTVEIKVTATPAAAGSSPITLSDQNVTFNYFVRHGVARGKN